MRTDPAQRHPAMLGLDEESDSVWLHGVVDCESGIVRQALLYLQAPRAAGNRVKSRVTISEVLNRS